MATPPDDRNRPEWATDAFAHLAARDLLSKLMGHFDRHLGSDPR